MHNVSVETRINLHGWNLVKIMIYE